MVATVLWVFTEEKDNVGDGGALETLKKVTYRMCGDVVQSWRGESKLEKTHTVECIGHIGDPGSS